MEVRGNMKLSFFFFFIAFIIACGEEEQAQDLELPPVSPPPNNPEPLPVLDQVVSIYAQKEYSPSRWTDAELEFEAPVRFQLPTQVFLTQGQSGNHWISVFLFSENEEDRICIYKGNGSRNKTSPCENNGDRYIFSYCTYVEDYDEQGCNQNPFRSDCKEDLALNIDDRISALGLEVSVNNGDSCATTEVEFTLRDLEYEN